jgi:hypothetical protein
LHKKVSKKISKEVSMKKTEKTVLFRTACVLALTLATVLVAPGAQAKDLTHRLGVGFKNNTSMSVPSIAAVYYSSKDMAWTASAGFDTQKNNSSMQVSAGVRQMIYFENNLNFYAGAQAGIINYETLATGKSTGFELLAVGGAEFFFTGLENLGFTVEAGVGLSTAHETRLRSTADDPLRAGVIFYF